jgi:hypothetical protein
MRNLIIAGPLLLGPLLYADNVTIALQGLQCPGNHEVWNGGELDPYNPATVSTDRWIYSAGQFNYDGDFNWVSTNWPGSNIVYSADDSGVWFVKVQAILRWADICCTHEVAWPINHWSLTKTEYPPHTWISTNNMPSEMCGLTTYATCNTASCCWSLGAGVSGAGGPIHWDVIPRREPPIPPVVTPPDLGIIPPAKARAQFITAPGISLTVSESATPDNWQPFTNVVTDVLGYVDFEWGPTNAQGFLRFAATNAP